MSVLSLPEARANGHGGGLQMYVGGVASKVVAMPRVYRQVAVPTEKKYRLGSSSPDFGIPMHAALFGVRRTESSGGKKPSAHTSALKSQPLCSAGKLMVVASLANFSLPDDLSDATKKPIPQKIREFVEGDPFPYAGQSRGEIDGSFDKPNKDPTSAPETQDDLACQVRGLANIYNHSNSRFNQGQLVGWDYTTMIEDAINGVNKEEGFLVPQLALADVKVAQNTYTQMQRAAHSARVVKVLQQAYSLPTGGIDNDVALLLTNLADEHATLGYTAPDKTVYQAAALKGRPLNGMIPLLISMFADLTTADATKMAKDPARIRVIGLVTKSGGPGDWIGVHLFGGAI